MQHLIDTTKVRADTPGCTHKIFLNSAGSSLMTKGAVQIMHSYLDKEMILGGYQTVPLYQHEIDAFYLHASALLQTSSANIAFNFNATDAYAKAVSSIPFKPGDYILTTEDDYVSNYILFFSLQKRFGIQIVRCNTLPSGDIDMFDLETKMLKYLPVLVSVTHIPSNSGKIQDVEQIGHLCEKYDIWYIVDACQSVGQMDIDVNKIKCDFLSATGRKFLRGPRGTGFLYVSDKALAAGLEPLLIDMRGATWDTENSYKPSGSATRFELWEANYSNILGLSEAIRYAMSIGLENIRAYNLELCQLLKEQLQTIPDIRITEEGSQTGSIVTFTSDTKTLDEYKNTLDMANISYSVGYRHFALIDFNKKNVDWVIRFSPHYFNTTDEILQVGEILRKKWGQ
ncbi:MAG: aminotransferase class V-fold PLP-dependent enzyme [Saprospiraceae bacterium]|nr:aminotransferase class V-fold PLP-dependent enzyme [Saprospiraceae bacterium]MBP6566583.1 aminotransferase class V-fold PLP-dependent enzyme [Saprospiraceae bacterium]